MLNVVRAFVEICGWTVIVLGALSMLIPLGIVLTRGRIVYKIDLAINPVTGRTVKNSGVASSLRPMPIPGLWRGLARRNPGINWMMLNGGKSPRKWKRDHET